MKTIATIRRAVPTSFCGMLIAVGGCAGAPSLDTVSPAEIAVNRAIEARAGEYAPPELRQNRRVEIVVSEPPQQIGPAG